ncbi:DNA adenine methylase [Elizabethkingia anophelis]|nr:DNA adenine methylase [Elizabethkingia anophelis]MCT4047254.1 DNA adenine methylase [Elizabethkingia anophelis]
MEIQKINKVSAINYFGGKYQWLEQLYNFFPEHTHFLDLFCGSMTVTLNKVASGLDTANDLDGSVINFFKVLRDQPDTLLQQLHLTPVSRQEYKDCYPIYSENPIEWARRFFVRCRMSFQGSGLKEHTGFNACVNTTEKGLSKNVSKYLSAVERLPEVIERLKRIQIESLDYKECIKKYDRKGTFIYVDPPYELRMRNYKKWYNLEFENDNDHIDLRDSLTGVKSMAMVSGYESDFYKDLYKDWEFIKLKPRRHSMKDTKLQEECIWINYPLVKKTLF